MAVSVDNGDKTTWVSQLLPRLGWNDGWDGGKDAVDAWGHNDLGIGDCQDDEDENQQAL